MNQEIKQKWVEALRSGKYEQGTTQLYWPSTNRYCCLGVLSCVMDMKLTSDGGSLMGSVGQSIGYTSFATAGLSEPDIEFLWKMNDREEKSFLEIADFIEQNL